MFTPAAIPHVSAAIAVTKVIEQTVGHVDLIWGFDTTPPTHSITSAILSVPNLTATVRGNATAWERIQKHQERRWNLDAAGFPLPPNLSEAFSIPGPPVASLSKLRGEEGDAVTGPAAAASSGALAPRITVEKTGDDAGMDGTKGAGAGGVSDGPRVESRAAGVPAGRPMKEEGADPLTSARSGPEPRRGGMGASLAGHGVVPGGHSGGAIGDLGLPPEVLAGGLVARRVREVDDDEGMEGESDGEVRESCTRCPIICPILPAVRA